MPRIFINGADIICPLKDYEFSFALPDGCTEITAGYRLEYSDAEVAVTEENGEFSAKVNASNLKIGTMTVQVSAKLKDGFIISAKKRGNGSGTFGRRSDLHGKGNLRYLRK